MGVSEATTHPREVAEAALAHVNKDKTEAAYARSDLLTKRAELLADWAAHCGADVDIRKSRTSASDSPKGPLQV